MAGVHKSSADIFATKALLTVVMTHSLNCEITETIQQTKCEERNIQ